jgi:hypothetical protein
MFTDKTIHILVAPPETLEITLVKEAAAILNKDPYDTRLLLTGKIPKLAGRYQTTEEADLIAKQLKTLGLVAIVLDETKPGASPVTRFVARALQFGEGEATFRDKGNQQIKVETKDVFLILKARFQLSADNPVTTTKMKLNLTATLMTGGLPVFKRVQETTGKTSSEVGYFVRIYDRTSLEPRVEFSENSFDYSCLGPDIAPSSFVNMNSIITKLRGLFPQAIFDDRLTKPSGMSGDLDKQALETERNCKYIYLYYQFTKNPV